MYRKMIFIFLFFFVACSNKIVQNNISEEQLNSLQKFSIEIKENLKVNNFDYLEENTYESIRNNRMLVEIGKMDFSNIDIFMSKIMFDESKIFSILGLNTQESTFYFELIYSYDYHSKKWKIYRVDERG
ncbi:MAG: hypothetical protein IJG31_03125 [Fusobacterium sp.]|nr:hypothetical protein [Fusobacterium sp.]